MAGNNCKDEKIREELEKSNSVRVGNYIVIDKMFDELKIKEIVKEVFGFEANLFIDLVAYSIVAYDREMTYELYGASNFLFSKLMDNEELARFLKKINKEHCMRFFELWNKGVNRKEKIFVYPYADRGDFRNGSILFFKSDDRFLDTSKNSVCYDYKNEIPLFYSGENITETYELAKELGYENICYVIEKGRYSVQDVYDLEEKGTETMIVLDGSNLFVRDIVLANKNNFEDRMFDINDNCISGTTIFTEVFADHKKRYVHIYYDKQKEIIASDIIRRNAVSLLNYGKSFIGLKNERLNAFWFQLKVNRDEEKIITSVELIQEEFDIEFSVCGYFCIITTFETDYKKAKKLYLNRKNQDLLCEWYKPYNCIIKSKDSRLDTLKYSKIFVEFVALIIKEEIERRLHGKMQTKKMVSIMNDVCVFKDYKGEY